MAREYLGRPVGRVTKFSRPHADKAVNAERIMETYIMFCDLIDADGATKAISLAEDPARFDQSIGGVLQELRNAEVR